MSGPKFVDRMQANADFLGNGAIEVNMYEQQIFDIVRRTSPALDRMPKVKATGAPHRYFEQTAVVTATFNDPRNLSPTPSGPTRVERSAVIKATVDQTNLTLFDVDVTRQQGQFAYLPGKDINDLMSGIARLEAANIWNGTDTSLTVPTTLQFVGLLTQITQQALIIPGASIIDGIKAEVAAMFANSLYSVMPTGIYINPILGDYIDREAKAQKVVFGTYQTQAGLTVKTLMTQAGELPLLSDPFLPSATDGSYGFTPPPAGNKNYFAAILSESLIEMPVVTGEDGNLNPRIFQLGLVNTLQGQYVGVHFTCVLAKGPSYAHAIVCVQRP